MAATPVDQNSVVIAQNVNATIFSQLWLVEKGLVGRDEFGDGCVFSPGFCQVQTASYSLLVLPDRMQMTIYQNASDPQATVRNLLGKIVEFLPETPYRAVGLNFNWHLTYPDGSPEHSTRRWFFHENAISTAFGSADCRFGAYYSKDVFDGVRLRLNASPIVHEGQQLLGLAFNFNRDLAPPRVAKDDILGLLGRWNEAAEMAKGIALSLGGD
jgi:hypothetical protein